MGVQIITPNDKKHWLSLRAQCITSTEVSALFNCSPYLTSFELWHQKRADTVQEFEETERMKWGSRLESAIAAGVSLDLGLDSHPMKDFFIDYDLKIGSSFDYFFGDDGILEIKNVDAFIYKTQWEGDEAPLHIEMQIQHQLLVSGRKRAVIGVLVGGNEIKTIERERDDAVCNAIKQKVAEFWAMTEAPAPDFTKDAEFIISQYKYAQPNKIMAATPDIEALATVYKAGAEVEKSGKAMKDAAKAELLMIIGDCEKVKGDTFSISAGLIGPSEYTVKRDGYRGFKISWKAQK